MPATGAVAGRRPITVVLVPWCCLCSASVNLLPRASRSSPACLAVPLGLPRLLCCRRRDARAPPLLHLQRRASGTSSLLGLLSCRPPCRCLDQVPRLLLRPWFLRLQAAALLLELPLEALTLCVRQDHLVLVGLKEHQDQDRPEPRRLTGSSRPSRFFASTLMPEDVGCAKFHYDMHHYCR